MPKYYSPGPSVTSDYAYICDQCLVDDGCPTLRWQDPDFILCFDCLKDLALQYVKPETNDVIVVHRKAIPESLRNKIFARDGYKCRTCGAPELLVLDHVVPFVLGGVTEESNLQTLCRSCNTEKAAKRI